MKEGAFYHYIELDVINDRFLEDILCIADFDYRYTHAGDYKKRYYIDASAGKINYICRMLASQDIHFNSDLGSSGHFC